ncbi:MAG: PaaI family thioesterase [Caulobacterales bacterium]
MTARTLAPTDEDLLDQIREAYPLSPSAQALGFELIAVEQAEQTIEAAFLATPDMVTQAGIVQSGFLTAMLDEALMMAGAAASDMTRFMSITDLRCKFINPVRPGRVVVRARVAKLGRPAIVLEGELRTMNNIVCVTATATAIPVEMARITRPN